jgi:glycosyltransferase involved in cell wall biosynthesis
MQNNITIITICFNNIEELKATCKSVEKQTMPPQEHWIIDGSKNEEIKNYLTTNRQPNYRKWVCESDNGIADAFNKGIKKASADFIQFLNSGDVLFSSTILELVQNKMNQTENVTWLHGQIQMQRGGHKVIIGKPFDENKVYRGMRATFHPTMFVHKSLFEKYSNFDNDLKIAMDYDFLVRIRKEPFLFINQPLVIFDNNGISSNNYLDSLKESKLVYEKHFGKNVKLILWQCRLKFLYYLLSTKLGKYLYNMKRKLGLENS